MPARRMTSPGFRDHRYKAVMSNLVDRRKALGLTQQALAEILGLHKQFVSRVELGERRLDFIEFSDYVRAMGLEPGEVLARVPHSSEASD